MNPNSLSWNKRVLLVDDNPSLHEDYRKVLLGGKSSGSAKLTKAIDELFGDSNTTVQNKNDVTRDYQIDSAFNGQEAIDMVFRAFSEGKPYALVFMDVRMPPGIDGITAVETIWQKVPETEVVICTAFSDYSLDEVTQRFGGSERFLFLKKPFDSVEVQQMAAALTKKWNLEEAYRNQYAELERLVDIRTQERDVERAKAVHGAKLMALGEMAGGIAHEINNPLTVISINAKLLVEAFQDETKKATDLERGLTLSKKIVTTSERIAKIIRGLRALSRSGEADPFTPISVGQIMEETLAVCREKFKINNVDLLVDVSDPLIRLECRQVQVVQILLNLLNNAFDAIESFPKKWVKVMTSTQDSRVIFRVEDCGNGIPNAVREKMFQPFFTTKSVGKGTGLGLGISKSMAESHSGSLEIDYSDPHTCFVLTLPCRQEARKAG